MPDESTPEQRANAVENALDSTLKAVRDKALEFQQLADRQRRRYNWARAATVILGVLTPTFVTFQTQHSGSPQLAFWLGIFAIAITAAAGIVGGLQASFKWGEGFGRATTTSLELEELANAIDLEALVVRTSPDYVLKYTKLTEYRERALRQKHLIIRKYTEGELALIQEADRAQRDKKDGPQSRELLPG